MAKTHVTRVLVGDLLYLKQDKTLERTYWTMTFCHIFDNFNLSKMVKLV